METILLLLPALYVLCLVRSGISWSIKRLLQWRVKRWSLTKGVIAEVDVEQTKQFKQAYGREAWILKLRYSYEVNGKEYKGSAKTDPWYITGIRAALATSDDLVGKTIFIRYKPGYPAKSTWLESDGGSGQLAAPANPNPPSGFLMLSLR